MNKNIAILLNSQIQHEFESAYMYLDFASFFDAKGLSGFATWYKVQADEEISHAMKFYDYLHQTNNCVNLLPINPPETKLENIRQILKMGLEQERNVTALIDRIYTEAEEVHDYATMNFLEWFIAEQIEEESEASGLLDQIDLFGDSREVLFELDKKFGKRKKAC